MATSLTWITDSIAGSCPIVSPDRPALALDDGRPFTYRELRSAEFALAAALHRAGVRRGDRVAILMRNSTEYVIAVLSIARIGAISVRPNWRLAAPELHYILDDSGARMVLFDAEFGATLDAVRSSLPVERWVARRSGAEVPEWADAYEDFIEHGANHADVAHAWPELGPDDPYTLMYTSGTTGSPKGALLSHGNALWIGTMQIMKFKFDETRIILNSGPMFHAGGFEVLLLPALLSHSTAVTLSSGAFSLTRLLHVARAQSVTTMLAYSFAVYDLVRLDDLRSQAPSSLERIFTGGDTIMPWVYDRLEEQLPEVSLVQSYSLTEGGVVGILLDHEVARGRERSVGRPIPMAEVKVVDALGEELPVGEIGEVLLRSPGVAVAYWNQPDASAATFVDGWCHTGDLGSIDEDGFLTLAGRTKDMIRSGGENIYPAEIERILTDHDDIGAAAVIGVPDEKFVEVGCALLQAHPGSSIDIEQIRRHCSERMAKFKVPKHFVVVAELPRNASGKILKNALRDEYGEVFGARI